MQTNGIFIKNTLYRKFFMKLSFIFIWIYKFIDNVELCFLKDKGFHADWKANNLTFDEILHL